MKTPKTRPTGANGGNGEGILCSLGSLLFNRQGPELVMPAMDCSTDGRLLYKGPDHRRATTPG